MELSNRKNWLTATALAGAVNILSSTRTYNPHLEEEIKRKKKKKNSSKRKQSRNSRKKNR